MRGHVHGQLREQNQIGSQGQRDTQAPNSSTSYIYIYIGKNCDCFSVYVFCLVMTFYIFKTTAFCNGYVKNQKPNHVVFGHRGAKINGPDLGGVISFESYTAGRSHHSLKDQLCVPQVPFRSFFFLLFTCIKYL